MADSPKMLAEWFWTDRWSGSSAFELSIEVRGLYREMLTQAWRRGCRLPNDPAAIQRVIGASPAEWERTWPYVRRYWRVEGESLVNDTQLEIYAKAQESFARASERGRKGGRASATARTQARTQVNAQVATQVELEQQHKSNTPGSGLQANASHSPSPRPPSEPMNGRAPGVVFRGERLKVFAWQVDDLRELLGKHFETFRLDEWFQALDRRVVASGEVLPGRDGGAWLKAETLAEAKRRGLPFAGEKSGKFDDDYGPDFPAAWQCRTCGEMHEGTRAQTGTCLKPRAASR